MGISQQPSKKFRFPCINGFEDAIASVKGEEGLTARTLSLSKITIFPSSHNGPTATNDDVFKFGSAVAVLALREKSLCSGINPFLLDKIFVLSGNVTLTP